MHGRRQVRLREHRGGIGSGDQGPTVGSARHLDVDSGVGDAAAVPHAVEDQEVGAEEGEDGEGAEGDAADQGGLVDGAHCLWLVGVVWLGGWVMILG